MIRFLIFDTLYALLLLYSTLELTIYFLAFLLNKSTAFTVYCGATVENRQDKIRFIYLGAVFEAEERREGRRQNRRKEKKKKEKSKRRAREVLVASQRVIRSEAGASSAAAAAS